MLRRHLRARTQTLKASGAALLLIALAGLAAPALAQLPTTCSNFHTTAEGTPMRLRLNHNYTVPNGCQEDPNASNVVAPGTSITGCYDGAEVDPMGNRLGHQTLCFVCQPGQAGCINYSPPMPMPGPVYIPPGMPNPFEGLFPSPYPDDPANPVNPWDGLPDDEPPWMPKYGPQGCLGFWYLPD